MKERRILLFTLFLAMLGLLALPALCPSAADEDQIQHPACPYCGMDRTKFAHSRILITYADGTSVGTCSLHCAALDLALKIGKAPSAILAADYNTRQLTDAEGAFWVIGGSKMGVMTKRAKWAFAAQGDARAFMAANGGDPATFAQALQASFEDMYADIQMIRQKRQKMKATKGS